jgi:aryl-alcohol dehydrogenase-like predicted oxidoreductase
MNHRPLGHTGLKVSPLCLGAMTWGRETDQAEADRILGAALEAGLNFVDTANVYNDGESERVVGRALRGVRERVILATKFQGRMGDGPNDGGHSRLHILRACEDSLRRLGTDHIDLYYSHRPSPDTPIEETLSALTDLVRAGKVCYIGCSTHPAWQVMEALAASQRRGFERYVVEQPPYNLLDRRIENELVPLCLRYGVGLVPWAPLAQGVLAGRYAGDARPGDSRAVVRGGIYEERVTTVGVQAAARFAEIARGRGISPAQLALLWVKDQPGVVAPIVGVRTLAHLQEALPVLEMTLTDEERAASDAINPPGSALVDFHNTAGWMKMRLAVGG